MKRICVAVLMVLVFATNVIALDSFIIHRNHISDVTGAIKVGYVNTYLLTVSTNKAVTIPTGSRYAIFAATADIWVKMGGAASIPAGDTTDGTGSELNPTIRFVEGQTTLGIISAAAAKVSVAFYK
jgi:hypothetical protein